MKGSFEMRYSLTLLVTLLSLLAFAQNNEPRGDEQRQPVAPQESDSKELEEDQPPLVLYGDGEKGVLKVTGCLRC